MSEPDTLRTVEDAANDGVFENLVTQFSNALDCFRELAQNSIDAGSPRIDVWTEFEVGEGHLGTIALHVDDFGEGMDEQIIDGQLTRLFASNKEDDLTKIGKFGIGFVSVFALKPQAVLMHTGRSGEYWEVLFNADRSFDKTRLDFPVEGTQITIFVEGDAQRYRELVVGIEETLRRWCIHADTEITFEDRTPAPGQPLELKTINQPFAVAGLVSVQCEFDHGATVVAAFHDSPTYGFYNRGLTLAQTTIGEQVFDSIRAQRLRFVSLKIKSRYLEHTLSRDTVLRDENYRKAMLDIDAAHLTLQNKLLSEIEAMTAAASWTLADMDRYSRLIGFLATERVFDSKKILHQKLFRGLYGRNFSPADMFEAYRRDGYILVSTETSPISRSLHALNIPVIHGRSGRARMIGDELVLSHPLDGVRVMIARCVDMTERGSFWGWFRQLFTGTIQQAVEASICEPQEVYLPVKVNLKEPEEHAPFLAASKALLDTISAGYRKLTTFEPTSVEAPFFVTARTLNQYMARPPAGAQTRSLEAAVNEKDPHFVRLRALWEVQPGMAAYCLAKSLLLDQDQLLHRDVDLIEAARAISA